MTINIICTSKPSDGLLHYSYEYCSLLNSLGIKTKLIIICHHKFLRQDYTNSIKHKYIHFENVFFDEFSPELDDISLIMGRSMATLSWIDFKYYSKKQQETLKKVFSSNLISVYSENHPTLYPKAIEFYSPKKIIDLCDHEVYPNGTGIYFEKTINFDIYKPYHEDVQFKYLFLGTNDKYYATVESVIENFSDHGILTYDASFIKTKYNNIFAPVENLLGIFDTYVYTKNTFDPAPRLFQECKYFNKNVIYLRDKSIKDGGSVYWQRKNYKPDANPILQAIKMIH
jgi:hypothetical protein